MQFNRKSTDGAGSNVPSPEWSPALTWAKSQGVEQELITCICTLRIHAPDLRLGLSNLFQAILEPTARSLVSQWAEPSNEAAQALENLASAVERDPSVFREVEPFPHEKPVKSQLRGRTSTHYLLGLLISKPPSGSREALWLVRLRVWLLVHSLQRYLEAGNFSDRYLLEVTSALRKACEALYLGFESDWIQPLEATAADLQGFESINLHLIDQAELLRENGDWPAADSLFLSIQAIARGDHGQRKELVERDLRWGIPPKRPEFKAYSPEPWDMPEPADDLPQAHFLFGGGDNRPRFVSVDVSSQASATHHALAGQSVLLAYREELQYLPWLASSASELEVAALKQWINTSLRSEFEWLATLAAFVWLQLETSRSLRRVEDFQVTDELSAEWSLCSDNILRRIPPARSNAWSPKTNEQRDWIELRAELNELTLIEPVRVIIESRRLRSPDAKFLGDFWDKHAWQGSATVAFTRAIRDNLPRLQPSMLVGVLPRHVFLSSGDATLAQLYSSHPRSGLSAACAYATWSRDELVQALSNKGNIDPAIQLEPVRSANGNVMGTWLSAIESKLIDAIRDAQQAIDSIDPSAEPLKYHNYVTCYWVAELLAATGARPNRDVFERWGHFDFTIPFVHINDKASDSGHQGRHVLLPRSLARRLENDYPKYLDRLASALEGHQPTLAAEIRALASKSPSAAIPLFFFLEESASGVRWQSVSEKSFSRQGLFRWPLPLNLFRHRLARRLRQAGVDPELIDALLGHAQSGTPTHGDRSFRVWKTDMDSIASKVEEIFDRLNFVPLQLPDQPSAFDGVRFASGVGAELFPAFGQIEREKRRRRVARDALTEARKKIEGYCAGRALPDLSEDEFDELSRQLLFNRSGLPQSYGGFKYRYLLKRLDKELKNTDRRRKLKRYYQDLSDEPSSFRALGANSIQFVASLKQQLDVFIPDQSSQIGIWQAAGLAALDLCLSSRVAARSVLSDVAKVQNIRLVTFKGRFYLEHAAGLEKADPNLAVSRFRITKRTASLLNRALGRISKTGNFKPWPLQTDDPLGVMIAKFLGRDAPKTLNEAVEQLAPIVDQANLITLPGILAGRLSGRINNDSIPWHDWIRLETGAIPCLELESADSRKEETLVEDAGLVNAKSLRPICGRPAKYESGDVLHKESMALFSALRKHLNDSEANSRTAIARRQQIALEMKKTIEGFEGRAAFACLLLAHWIYKITYTGRRKERLKLKAVTRYVSALAPAFLDVALEADLARMDALGVTAIYGEILLSRCSITNQSFVAKRLVEFHRWAAREYGIVDPNWSELPLRVVVPKNAWGIVTESEYQHSLSMIKNHPGLNTVERVAGRLLMIFYQRFGLRKEEPWGLRRREWQRWGDEMVISLKDNRVRTIKSRAGHRVVPLVFTLSDLERETIQAWDAEMDSRDGGDPSEFVFRGVNDKDRAIDLERLCRILNDVLKVVTGSDSASVHDCRRSAGNLIGIALANIQPASWASLGGIDQSKIRQILLGMDGPTRRADWALAVFLGHAGSRMSFANYILFLADWTDELVNSDGDQRSGHKFRNAIDLDSFPQRAPDPSATEAQMNEVGAAEPIPTMERLLKLSRLVARGQSFEMAADRLSVARRTVDILRGELTKVADKLYLQEEVDPPKKVKRKKGEASDVSPERVVDSETKVQLFLRKISDNAWHRLLRNAQEIDQSNTRRESGDPSQFSAMIKSLAAIEPSTVLTSRWHLVLFEEAHFRFSKALIDFLELPMPRFRMFRSRRATDEIILCAQSAGFDPRPLDDADRKAAPDTIAAVYFGPQRLQIQSRCAITMLEDTNSNIRNTVELYLMILVAAACASYRMNRLAES